MIKKTSSKDFTKNFKRKTRGKKKKKKTKAQVPFALKNGSAIAYLLPKQDLFS